MARVRQFANDLGINYNQAKDLINKGRSRRDGGSQILEKTMNKAKPIKAAKGKFPDLSGDGKTTMKDILIGRGVIEKALGGTMRKKMGARRTPSVRKNEPKEILTPFKGVLKTSKGETLRNIDGKTFLVKPNPKFKKPRMRRMRDGGAFRGCGAQLSGKKFKGVF